MIVVAENTLIEFLRALWKLNLAELQGCQMPDGNLPFKDLTPSDKPYYRQAIFVE